MSSNSMIDSIIDEALAGQSIPSTHQHLVTGVKDTLAGKAQQIAEGLIEAGVRLGANRASVTSIVTEAGLYVEPVVEVAESSDGESVDIAGLLARVSALEALAARHGLRV